MKPLFNSFKKSYGMLKNYQFYSRLSNFITQLSYYKNQNGLFGLVLAMCGLGKSDDNGYGNNNNNSRASYAQNVENLHFTPY
jgi:hypothetical protein